MQFMGLGYIATTADSTLDRIHGPSLRLFRSSNTRKDRLFVQHQLKLFDNMRIISFACPGRLPRGLSRGVFASEANHSGAPTMTKSETSKVSVLQTQSLPPVS